MRKLNNRFLFTDKNVRSLKFNGEGKYNSYWDAGCPHLAAYVYPSKTVYYICIPNKMITIGNVFEVSIDDARRLVQNVEENEAEFRELEVKHSYGLYRDFKDNGWLPRAKAEPEKNDNILQRLQDLESENGNLRDILGNVFKMLGEGM